MSEQNITAAPVGEQDGEKTYKCEKCGQVKKQSEGRFVLGGSAFCCKECCPSDGTGASKHEDGEVCEFC